MYAPCHQELSYNTQSFLSNNNQQQQQLQSKERLKKILSKLISVIVGYLLFNPLRGEPLSCLVEMSKPVYIPPHRRGEGATVTGSECASQSLHSSTRQLFSDVLVINLKRRGDRLKRFTRSATRAFGTACWSRFDAIDGSTDEAARDGAFTTAWDATQNASYDRHVARGPRRASAGERGCALSHVGIWRTVAASTTSDDDWTLVCEDDCQFDDAFAVELEQRWSAVPHDADLV